MAAKSNLRGQFFVREKAGLLHYCRKPYPFPFY